MVCRFMVFFQLLENELVDATCVPWFFPTIADNYTKVCDPWESVKFFEEYNAISDGECQHCLPDCESQIYEVILLGPRTMVYWLEWPLGEHEGLGSAPAPFKCFLI